MNYQAKPVGLFLATLPIFLLVALLTITIMVFGDNALSGANQMVLLLCTAFAGLLGYSRGIPWQELLDHMVDSVKLALPAILILLLVGSLAGSWIVSGIVPTMIYYGLLVLNPDIFLITAIIVSALVSVTTGSSWSTMATIGVALMGVGVSLGQEPAAVAGAIISGAYFGDKISPLSDTTNLAAGVGGTDLFTHISYLLYTTVPSILITLLLFAGISLFSTSNDQAVDTQPLLLALENRFTISVWLMLVPLAVIGMIIKRVPALPALFAGTLLGVVCALVIQADLVSYIGSDMETAPAKMFAGVMRTLYGSVTFETGNAVLDELLSTRGMSGMLNTVWLIIAAMLFGGAMGACGFLQRITASILSLARSDRSLIAAAVGSCAFTNVTASDQYLSVVVPGRMFSPAFSKAKLAPENLSRSIEDGGTVTSVLVPWNTCGAYVSGVLGVATLDYAPFAIFCICSPLMSIFYAFFNIRIRKLTSDTMPKGHINQASEATS